MVEPSARESAISDALSAPGRARLSACVSTALTGGAPMPAPVTTKAPTPSQILVVDFMLPLLVGSAGRCLVPEALPWRRRQPTLRGLRRSSHEGEVSNYSNALQCVARSSSAPVSLGTCPCRFP